MNPDESRNGTTKGTKLTKSEELGKALRSTFQVFRPISASSSSARMVAWFAVAHVLRSVGEPGHFASVSSCARDRRFPSPASLTGSRRTRGNDPAVPCKRARDSVRSTIQSCAVPGFRREQPPWMAVLRGGGAPAGRAGRGLRARRSRARAPPRAGWHSEHRAGHRCRCWRERGRSPRCRREPHSRGRN